MKGMKGRSVLRMVSPRPPYTPTMWGNGTRNTSTKEVLWWSTFSQWSIFSFHSLVYTLWKFPDLLLSFTTWPPVLEKLKGGAGVCIVGLSDLRFYLYAAFYPFIGMRAGLSCFLIRSYRSWKTCKVMKFKHFLFQTWKVMECNSQSLTS